MNPDLDLDRVYCINKLKIIAIAYKNLDIRTNMGSYTLQEFKELQSPLVSSLYGQGHLEEVAFGGCWEHL